MLGENTGKSLNLQIWMGLAHFKILIFTDFSVFKYHMGRFVNRVVRFCHPLQAANICMRFVQNSLRYVNIMTSESIFYVFCPGQVYFKEFKN